MNEKFSGDQKHLDHFLLHYERKIINICLPLVPAWMSTVHLTLLTLFWSVLIVYCGFLSDKNINWLWGFTACIFMQHVTDMLDGEVGRKRNTGLIKWGFYMDHFLDYIFLCAIITGYSFLLPSSCAFLALLCLAFSGGFMVHTFLDFAITNDFKISFNRFGVSEIRYILMAMNTALIFTGKELFVRIFPLIVLLYLVGLIIVVFRSQIIYRRMDTGK